MKTLFKILAFFGFLILLQSCKKDKPTPPVISTAAVTEISYTTAFTGGEATNEGGAPILSKGICWSTSPNPTISNSITTTSGGLGSFSCQITSLTANTTYYVRAYATNSAGTGYGEQISFTTIQISSPALTTTDISSISTTTAVSGGTITSENGAPPTVAGICWSTSHNPTISDSKTTDVIGSSTFTSNLTELLGNTTYYVRSYATNSAGTSYGNEVSFTTSLPIAPSLTTKTITSLTLSSFTSGGTITNNGGAPITSRGLCWNSTHNPTIANNKSTESTNDNNFISNIIGLTPNSIYYIRAYATNDAGTSYGNELTVYTYAVTDIEGNGYHSVTIGTQTWLKEDLKVTKYSNGDPIATTSPIRLDISAETSPKYQWAYNGEDSNAAIYGRLYTWFAVSDSRNICPTGWHVATQSDWNNMINWLLANGYNYDGGTAYEAFNKLGISLSDTIHWVKSDVPGSIGNNDYPQLRNKTGFSALPAGTRTKTGQFLGLGSTTSWWTSTENLFSPDFAWAAVMNYNGTYVILNGHLKHDNADPVRCTKD
jgi:uncharacterized protein (TIGR02145 family)